MSNAALEKIKRSYRYRDLDTAIFLALSLYAESSTVANESIQSSQSQDSMPSNSCGEAPFTDTSLLSDSSFFSGMSALSNAAPLADLLTLAGILMYENAEYRRSINLLQRINKPTANFYLALAFKKIKKYENSIAYLEQLIKNPWERESSSDGWISSFMIDPHDKEYLYSLQAQAYIQNGKGKLGTEKFILSMRKECLLSSADHLMFLDGDRAECNHSAHAGSGQRSHSNQNAACSHCHPSWNARHDACGNFDASGEDPLRSMHDCLSQLRSYHSKAQAHMAALNCIPILNYISSLHPLVKPYYLSRAAGYISQYGDQALALDLFKGLRESDPTAIDGLDKYSTLLWQLQKESLLGLLAKELILSHPDHHITWIVIGNYYSYKRKTAESCTCLFRSLSIEESPQAYILLGFEYNILCQYLEAQKYFLAALSMSPCNDRAFFGLGIVCDEAAKKSLASGYFKQALDLNPNSLTMKAYVIRFYVKYGDYDVALSHIKDSLSLGDETRSLSARKNDPSGRCTNNNDIGGRYGDECAKAYRSGADCRHEYSRLVESIRKNEYSDIEELILCEFSEILTRQKCRDLATEVLRHLSIRTSTYYSKVALLQAEE